MLTVLMATRNGGRTLASVLECFSQLQAPSSGWKLVIVDNGSTDLTRNIIESFRTALPLTYVFEEALGKNVALNSGLAYIDGDLVVFTDDDVFPRPDWLVQFRRSADTHQAYSMFGGVILPRWEVTPPSWVAWVPPGPFFTVTDRQLGEGPVDPGSIYGPNMAIRSTVFEAGTRFDPSIGPRGADYPMGSESELLERLGRQGHKAWHAQGAMVEHFIRDYQIDKSWILKRAVRFGRGRLRLLRASNPTAAPPWTGVPPRYFLRMIKRVVRITIAWLTSNEQDMLVARWELNYFWGIVLEATLLRLRRYAQENRCQESAKEAS